jgi:probable rRNA maturation factor
MKRPILLDMSIDHSGWRHVPRLRAQLEAAARVSFDHLPERFHFPAMVTVFLTGDATMRRLNQDFRGVGRATNVLSFPQFEPRKLPKKGRKGEAVHLGDIAMAYQYIVGEAKKDHKILINHIIHLLIHGILHLFGYDHSSDGGAARMERLEKRIMASLDLPDPYKPETKAARKK